jgi:hypothetical protein
MSGDEQSPRAARMFSAVQGLEARLGRRVTLDEIGAWTGEREGREPYAGSVVRRWLRGLSEPRGTAAWSALADVLGVEPGWLAFGTPNTRLTVRDNAAAVLGPDLGTDTREPSPHARDSARRARKGKRKG